MSGLVSKWATDTTLLEEAKKQDRAHQVVEKKRGIESKWADAPDLANSKESASGSEKKGRNKHKHHESRLRDHDSPAKRGNARLPHPKHRHPETPPRSAGSDERAGPSKKNHRRTSRGSVDDEELAPMSDAAKAFAARLGMSSPPSPPSSRDGDLASRLGVTTENKDKNDKNDKNDKHTKGHKHKEKYVDKEHFKPKQRSKPDKPRLDREDRPQPRAGEKYLPPKERRQREQQARQSQAALEEEEKAAEELRQLLDKLDSKELDWASFD